jgi:hypothetical protein
LAVADISGYTRYLAGVELEHSADVLADLIGSVVAQLDGPVRVAKLEGDAVFGAAPEPVDGNRLFGAIEAAYDAFADRRDQIVRASTCACKACARIESLELKFVVHFGEYATHRVGRNQELVGSDVVVAHRLLKNTVNKRTGLRAYALFSAASVTALGLDADRIGMTVHEQRFEGVGRVSGFVCDLAGRSSARRAERVAYVGVDDADFEVAFDSSAAPPVGWDYLTSPAKQELWRADRERHDNPGGVPGVGSVAHCVHGKAAITHQILDWRPFRYYTYRTDIPVMGTFVCTDEITPLPDGRWRYAHRVRRDGALRQRATYALFGRKQRAATREAAAKLERLLANPS